MNIKNNNQLTFGLIAAILSLGWAMLTATPDARAETQSRQAGKPEKLLVAQVSGSGNAGDLAQIVDLKTGVQNNEVIVQIRSSQGIDYTAFKLEDPLRLVLDFPNMAPTDLTGVMEVNAGVVSTIKPTYFKEAKVLRLEVGLTKGASYEILRPGTYVMEIRLKEAGAAPAPQEEEAPQVAQAPAPTQDQGPEADEAQDEEEVTTDPCDKMLAGVKERFNMDFQNANIKNIFRIIAEVSGFNLVLSPDVTGIVNIRLIDVPWNQAFEIILENNLLGRQCEGNIIRIVPNKTLLAAQVAEPLITEMIRINYADIGEMLKNVAVLKSQRGSVASDKRTNTLILTDIRDKVDEMISVIKTLDVKTPQVMIESKIVEVTRNYAQELGIKWGAFTERSSGGDNFFPAVVKTGGYNPIARQLIGPSERVTRQQDTTNFNQPFLLPEQGFVPLDPGYIVDLGTASAPNGAIGVLLSTLDQDHVLDIQLEALENEGKSRTIANPKVTTLDNKEAKIQSGQRFPVQTSSANEGTKVQFVDANLELKVTPHITADENIYMKISATQNNADFGQTVLGIPTILTKEAFTEVLVYNGATTVLGGLYQKATSETRGSVPFFSDIPFIGYLFKNRAESDDISELLIFVTPTIVRGDLTAPSQ